MYMDRIGHKAACSETEVSEQVYSASSGWAGFSDCWLPAGCADPSVCPEAVGAYYFWVKSADGYDEDIENASAWRESIFAGKNLIQHKLFNRFHFLYG